MHPRGGWLLAAALLAGGAALLGLGLLFGARMTPGWFVATTAGGAASLAVGGRLLLGAAVSRYGQTRVPDWIVLLIVLALLSVLPIAALLNR